MKVNINGIWYDANVQPVAIELTEADKKNIANMLPEATKYISYPSKMDFEDVKSILSLSDDEKLKDITAEQLNTIKLEVKKLLELFLGKSILTENLTQEFYSNLLKKL